MLMERLVKDAVTSTTREERHQPFDAKKCINVTQRKVHCEACVQVCPKQAIIKPESGTVDWNKCVSCALCAQTCDSKAFGYTEEQGMRMARLAHQQKESKVLACRMVQGEADDKAWCIASYPWEQLADLALSGRVELVLGDCERCERAFALMGMAKKLERLRFFLGDARYEMNVAIMQGETERAPRGLTRRDLFGKLFSRAQIPDEKQDCETRALADGQTVQTRLYAHIRNLPNDAEELGFTVPTFSEACWGCGICEKICPAKAIRVEPKTMTISCMAHRCTACGICMEVCMEKAVDVQKIRLHPNAMMKVRRFRADRCTACHAPVKKGTSMCTRCQAIAMRKKK